MNWVSDVDNAISRGAKHILSFNEPDLATEANMTPLEAAKAYLQWIQPFAGRVKLGAPAASESPSGTMVCLCDGSILAENRLEGAY